MTTEPRWNKGEGLRQPELTEHQTAGKADTERWCRALGTTGFRIAPLSLPAFPSFLLQRFNWRLCVGPHKPYKIWS